MDESFDSLLACGGESLIFFFFLSLFLVNSRFFKNPTKPRNNVYVRELASPSG